MPIVRYLGAALCVFAVVPAASQQATPQARSGPDIIVRGVLDSPSAWRRAESAHVIVTSKGSEAELKRITNNLERLHALMARLYHRSDAADDIVKLQVTLIDSANFFRAMGLVNARSEEGPYAGTFSRERYYDPREDGSVLAVARTDQIVDLDTALAQDRDITDAAAMGDEDSGSAAVRNMQPPIARPWEAVLYSAYAQHFLLTYMPGAYPRWYLDGVGALFSTMTVRRDGKIDYALPPPNYRQVFRSYGDLNVADILTGRYLDEAPGAAHWTPYHAWLLAHFFLYSNLKPERAQQFQRYMAAIQQGTPMAEAAKIFGDIRKLKYEISGYAEGQIPFARTDTPPTVPGDPLIDTLTRSSAAMIEPRIEMSSRLAAPATAPDGAARGSPGYTIWSRACPTMRRLA